MRRIRNSTVITNGEMQKIWQKTLRAPLKENLMTLNCLEYEYSSASNLLWVWRRVHLYIVLSLYGLFKTPNIAEQATPKRRYLY